MGEGSVFETSKKGGFQLKILKERLENITVNILTNCFSTERQTFVLKYKL